MDLAVLRSEHIPCEKVKGKGSEHGQPNQRINIVQRIFTELIIFQHTHLKFQYIEICLLFMERFTIRLMRFMNRWVVIDQHRNFVDKHIDFIVNNESLKHKELTAIKDLTAS